MNKVLLAIALCILPVVGFAAQIPITQIDKFNSSATKINDMREATNTRLATAQSNFTELYTLLGGNPWLAQTTAPNIYNVFWIDTSGTGPVLKYWDGNSWEALTFDSTGEYALPVATTSTLGGVKDGAGVTIAADGTISADDQLVGDCTVGPCLDGTSDGGNYIKLWAGTGSYWTALQGGSPAANRSWRLPIAAPPAAGTTYLMNMDEYGQMGFAPAVSDTAYGVGWNGDTGAASKNAIYDKIETISGGSMTYPGAGLPISTGTAWGTSITPGDGVAAALGFAPDTAGGFLLYSSYADDPLIAWDSSTITETVNNPVAGTNKIGVKSGVFQAYDANMILWPDAISATEVEYLDGLTGDISTSLAGKESVTPASLTYTADTSILAANLLVSKFVSNYGAGGEIDLILPALSYNITRTFLVESAHIIEVCPPSGEAFDLAGTTLTTDYCIDSSTVTGDKAVFTRLRTGASTYKWSVDVVRGTWVDTGVSD